MVKEVDNNSININTKDKSFHLTKLLNENIICIKNAEYQLLFYIQSQNLLLYLEKNNLQTLSLFSYKSENKSSLNLTHNDYFSFESNLYFNTEIKSSKLFLKAIINQHYFLKPYDSNIYNESNNKEFGIWNKYLEIQEKIIDEKDFYFIAKDIEYTESEARVSIKDNCTNLNKKLKKGLSFNAYLIEDVDIDLPLHLWDEDYIDNFEYFGNILEIKDNFITFILDFRLRTKKKKLILRASYFGEDIQLSRLKKGMNDISTHFFSNYMFGNKYIKEIDKDDLLIKSGDISFFNNKLNDSQKEAVLKSLLSKELFLIQGPPGTGKTQVITEIALQEVLKDKKVLITSQMNLAVDEPLDRIKKQRNQIRIKKIDNNLNSYNDQNPQIYGATLNKCGSSELKNLIFDTVIVDEVSKATPPELTLAILLSKKVILVGDHKQLPPTIKNEEIDYLVEELGINVTDLNFNKSIFETLIEKNPHGYTMLNTQYRMHPDIAKAIAPFYDNRLLDGVNKEDKNHQLSVNKNLIWIDINCEESKEGTSYYNKKEITKIQEILEFLNNDYSKFNIKPSVGIITFYGPQSNKIYKTNKDKTYSNFSELKIDTVDRFQGQEKDIIILSMVRSNHRKDIGFAREPNRINVAFSRAKNMLIIVGNKKTFSGKNSQCKHVIDLCENNK